MGSLASCAPPQSGQRASASCEIFADCCDAQLTSQLCQPQGVAPVDTMKLILQLFCLAALVLARPQVLQSQLPGQPIEDPEVWTWGQHPNGVGYKAPNDLLYETCKATPNS